MLHQQYTTQTTLGENSLVFVSSEDERRRSAQINPNLVGRVFLWNESPPSALLGAGVVVDVRRPLIGQKEPPQALAQLTTIAQLHVPATIVSGIGVVAQRLHGLLRVHGDEDSALPPDVRLPFVSTLIVSDKGVLSFEPDAFPRLRQASVNLDKKGHVLGALLKISTLAAVGLEPSRKADRIFEQLQVLRSLRYLKLIGGNLETLDGIEALPLTDVHLHDMRKLRSIGALARCKTVREVSIGYCKHIVDVDAFSRIRGLRRLEFFGCGQMGLERVIADLERQRLDELLLGDSLPQRPKRSSS